MRIILSILFTFSTYASIDQARLKSELEYLRNNAFNVNPNNEEIKKPYFDRSDTQAEGKPTSGIVDLDQKYFSDSVSTKLAAPETKK